MADNPENKNNKNYSATSIKVMEGLEAVRKRPAMYIGNTGQSGLHHLVYEVVDNSVDEALGGFCTKIIVILHTDGSVSVEDNGRGIPTDIHPTEQISAAEVVLTKLHAGGKFDKDSYKFSGGLHGVGISVVNALSKKLLLEIYKDGEIYSQVYEKGIPLERLKVTGKTDKVGTKVRFMPDPEIFKETVEFSFEILSARFRELAFLNKNLNIIIEDNIHNKEHNFLFEGGIVTFIELINAKKNPLFQSVVYIKKEDEVNIVEIALQYNDGYAEQIFSFVNSINTIDGGTHVSGFKSALTKVCNKRAQLLKFLKPGEAFSSEDVREGLVAVISIKIPEPQFEGQTKGKLGNSEIKGIVDSIAFAALDTFFEENPSVAKKILEKAEISKRAREAAKKARDLTRKKSGLENLILPGKLAACSSNLPQESELFIVEGDSAGGSAKQARNRMHQAVLPLKGKILNVEKARLDKILGNEEIKALIAAIGCSVDAQEFNCENSRYHKIICMTDADVDGSHIRALLLTFFFRYMKPLIESGYIYIAKPPLYKVKIGKISEYLTDEISFKTFIFNYAKDNMLFVQSKKESTLSEWKKLCDLVLSYDLKLNELCKNFNLDFYFLHKLILFTLSEKIDASNEALFLEKLKTVFSDFIIKFETEKSKLLKQRIRDCKSTDSADCENEIELDDTQNNTVEEFLANSKKECVFKKDSFKFVVKMSFFESEELFEIQKIISSIIFLEEKEWLLSFIDKNKSESGIGILNFISAVLQMNKANMYIQRYKGLGEMNPEQLWETSMDPATRILLKVTIEDALEADSWFTTLMGDDVMGRKEFIQEFGSFVSNLDV